MVDDHHLTSLAVAAKRGDRDAASAFVRGTQRQVWQLLRHLTDPRVAEDLTQECYLRAFSSLKSFRGRSPARTWLLAIARRVAADHLRTKRRRPQLAEGTDWTSAAERSQPRDLPDLADGCALREAIADLGAERREAFTLTQILGLSYEEAAEVCGCRVGTIRSRVARARMDLAQHLRTDTAGTGERSAPHAQPGT